MGNIPRYCRMDIMRSVPLFYPAHCFVQGPFFHDFAAACVAKSGRDVIRRATFDFVMSMTFYDGSAQCMSDTSLVLEIVANFANTYPTFLIPFVVRARSRLRDQRHGRSITGEQPTFDFAKCTT